MLCTTTAFRFRLVPMLLTEGVHPGGRRAPRTQAVPMDQAGPSAASLFVAMTALVFALASLWRQDSVVTVTRVALDGLREHQVAAHQLDLADLPAMDPSLAQVVDPRTTLMPKVMNRPKPSPVQPFEYQVRGNETLEEIAARFGTDVNALLWNNGLDSPDQLQSGNRLMILPVRGVLHLVKAGETLTVIAERYGSRVQDVVMANSIDRPDHIVPGQVIVVAGGSVPMPGAAAETVGELMQMVAEEIAPVEAVPAPAPEPQAPPAPAKVEERLPNPPGAAGWQRDFILSVAPGARESMRRSGVPASVTLAQAILESDWGRSKLTREANNLFGIKALRGPGTAGIYEINTWEVYDGQNVTVLAAFKAYTTLADSIVDHGRWFHDNSRYHGALRVKADPRAFARAINEAGYATDPAYAPKLIGLMDKFDLYAYDVKDGE
jgi:flagellum-specific peptidoglycan hydrolase FlgJ